MSRSRRKGRVAAVRISVFGPPSSPPEFSKKLGFKKPRHKQPNSFFSFNCFPVDYPFLNRHDCYYRDEGGHIVGRCPGILGWLRWNCPELVPHYKAIMAYKAQADKVQMATGLQEKYSIVDVIDVFIEFGESALEKELQRPREKLREVLRGLRRRTMRALDDEMCYRLGLMKTKRTG